MEHCKSIRELERVLEKALDFTATLCRRLARAPLDVRRFPVIVAETLPLAVMAPLQLQASLFLATCSFWMLRKERDFSSHFTEEATWRFYLSPKSLRWWSWVLSPSITRASLSHT